MRLLEYSDHGYDSANRLVTSTNGSDVFNMYLDRWVDTPLATYVYHYDDAGRLTAETDAEGTASFTYDHANELTGVSGSRSESYTYDANGNRTDTGYSTGTENETTASPGATYTYDDAGNLVSQTDTSTHTVTTYTYDFRNRLTQVTAGGTIVATYTYDALNRRIGIDDRGTQTWTVYDGTSADALPYADFNGSGSLTEWYLSGVGVVNGAVVDQLLARTSAGGTTAWYLTDKLGSVRDIASTSGSELDHIVYDSFGNIVTETHATSGDRFKYAGMEYDATVGQYYDRARYYDEAIGRFMGQDPMGFKAGDAGLYRYVGNGPTDATDPNGLMTASIECRPSRYRKVTRPGGKWIQYSFRLRGEVQIDKYCIPLSIEVFLVSAQKVRLPNIFDVIVTSRGKGTYGFVTGWVTYSSALWATDPTETWYANAWGYVEAYEAYWTGTTPIPLPPIYGECKLPPPVKGLA